jgi:hypothetical protein
VRESSVHPGSTRQGPSPENQGFPRILLWRQSLAERAAIVATTTEKQRKLSYLNQRFSKRFDVNESSPDPSPSLKMPAIEPL